MRARLFIGLFLGSALLGLIAIFLVTRRTSTASAADHGYVLERKTAEQIVTGHSIILAGRLNEWILRWSIARQLPAATDAFVLGSSHSLGVTAAMVGAAHSMNFSISGSSLADHFVTAGILEARALHPRRWVIFADAWLFDRGADYNAWQLRAADLTRFETFLSRRVHPALEPKFELAPATAVPAWRKLSLDPLVQTFDEYVNKLFLQPDVAPEGIVDATVLDSDGSIRTSFNRRPPKGEEVEKLALNQFGVNPDRHRYGSYPEIDEVLWKYFEQWILHCQEQGDVCLVLPPYHPAIYPKIVRIPGNQLQRVEHRVREFARAHHVLLLGSYDPSAAGIPAAEFVDGDHLREAGLKHLLAPLAASSIRLAAPTSR